MKTDRGRETGGASVFPGTWADFGAAPGLRQTRPGSQSLLLALPAWHLPAQREERGERGRIIRERQEREYCLLLYYIPCRRWYTEHCILLVSPMMGENRQLVTNEPVAFEK